MSHKIVIIGHPLCADENRISFSGNKCENINLIAPAIWPTKSLGQYITRNSIAKRLIALPVYFSGKNSFFLFKGLKSTLNLLKPDIIYCWEEPWCLSTMQAILWAKSNKRPFLFYSAENKFKNIPVPFFWVQNFVYSHSQGAIVITEKAKIRLLNSGFKNRIAVIPLSVRTFQWCNVNPKLKTLVYLGRLIDLKGVDLLIKVLTFLPEYTLLIIGSGNQIHYLKKLAKKLNVFHQIIFHGKIDNQNLEPFLSKCSLALFPTLENEKQAEQFGKAPLECITAGLPVLSSSTGNFIEWEKKFPTFYTFKEYSIQNIANCIIQIHENFPMETDRILSRQQVVSDYSPESVKNYFVDFFKQMLHSY